MTTTQNRLGTSPITFIRLPDEAESHPEQKDPSIIERDPQDKITPYRYIAYTSSGKSNGQQWKVARYGTNDLQKPWQELESPILNGLSGPQLCAPALSYEFKDGKPHYHLYIQTACFEPDGVIMEAVSEDGIHFEGLPEPLVTKNSIEKPKIPVIGVYDPSYSQVSIDGRMHDCLTFTGITAINELHPLQAKGDIYMMLRDRTCENAQWSKPKLALKMKDISFHNQLHHAAEGKCVYEWCPEGTQVISLDDSHYLMIGVCFLAKGEGCDGQRQRVFLAAADNINGPFVSFARPFKPTDELGENGHPDTVLNREKGTLQDILQERGRKHPDGEEAPWSLRLGEIALSRLIPLMDEAVARRRSGLPDMDLTSVLRNEPATRLKPKERKFDAFEENGAADRAIDGIDLGKADQDLVKNELAWYMRSAYIVEKNFRKERLKKTGGGLVGFLNFTNRPLREQLQGAKYEHVQSFCINLGGELLGLGVPEASIAKLIGKTMKEVVIMCSEARKVSDPTIDLLPVERINHIMRAVKGSREQGRQI